MASDGPADLLSFVIESQIRGYHEYKATWKNPALGEILSCHREPGNAHDTHAVAVKKVISNDLKVVGHVPRRISTICSCFLNLGGVIICTVNSARRYSTDIS